MGCRHAGVERIARGAEELTAQLRRLWIACVALCAFLGLLSAAWSYDRPPVRLDGAEGLDTCPRCHERGADGSLGLRKEMQCGGCHAEIATRFVKAAHAHPSIGVENQGRALCLDCHAYHDAGERFLVGDPTAVCQACHPEAAREPSHPVGIVDPRTGAELTCTSGCHDPHGSSYRWFCRLEPGRALCVSCHGEMR